VKWFKQNRWLLSLLPACLFTIFFVGYGIGISILESFSLDSRFTLEHFVSLFQNKSFLDSLPYSLFITTTSTVISVVLGIALAKFLCKVVKARFPKLLVWLPMFFPHFVWGYMVYLLLSQTGFFSSVLYQLGMIEDITEFPVLFRDRHGIGITLTYIWKEVPFVVLMLVPIFAQLNSDHALVVKTLGGSEWDVFKTAEWPWIFPVVLEVTIIIFSFVFSAFEVPTLLGITYPKMISVLSYEWFFEGDWSKRGLSYAAMTIVSFFVIVLMVLTQMMFNRKRYHLMKGNGS
jgi:putative spermidine/putrescine transport system permease protein